MATTFLQKLRLAIGGWQRRREDRQQEFVRQNATWTPTTTPTNETKARVVSSSIEIDREGLQCAFLDESGRIAYYLDTETGEVMEMRDGGTLAAPRYRRVPARSDASEEADRRAFVEQLEAGDRREELARRVDAPEAFRKSLAADRALERAWYNFKNERATAAIEAWLRGLR